MKTFIILALFATAAMADLPTMDEVMGKNPIWNSIEISLNLYLIQNSSLIATPMTTTASPLEKLKTASLDLFWIWSPKNIKILMTIWRSVKTTLMTSWLNMGMLFMNLSPAFCLLENKLLVWKPLENTFAFISFTIQKFKTKLSLKMNTAMCRSTIQIVLSVLHHFEKNASFL